MERQLKKLNSKNNKSRIVITDQDVPPSTVIPETTLPSITVRERVTQWTTSDQRPPRTSWFRTTVNTTADLGQPLDISEHSSFLENGGTAYTFPRFYATTHDEREHAEHNITTGPDLQASSEHLSRTKYPSVSHPAFKQHSLYSLRNPG